MPSQTCFTISLPTAGKFLELKEPAELPRDISDYRAGDTNSELLYQTHLIVFVFTNHQIHK